MKIQKNYFLLCENAIVGEKGKASIISIYDVVFADKLPAAHGKLIFVANYKLELETKDGAEIEVRVSLKSPSNKELVEKDGLRVNKVLDRSKKIQSMGDIFEVNGVVFNEYGLYKCVLSVNGKEIAVTQFEVKKQPN